VIGRSLPLPPVVLPEPETLLKYGKLAMGVLNILRKEARAKGREHKKILIANGLIPS
jgi:hypothetical protein